MEWISEGLRTTHVGLGPLPWGEGTARAAENTHSPLPWGEGSVRAPENNHSPLPWGEGVSRSETGEGVQGQAQPQPASLSREEARRVETDFKYEGYLVQQEKQIERMKRAEARHIPDWFDYKKVSGLSREVVEKLTKVRPLTLAQASRIPGITPAAVSLVNVYIEIFQQRAAEQAPAAPT